MLKCKWTYSHTHTLLESIAHAHGLSVTHTNTHTQDLYTSQPSTFMYILRKRLWEKLASEMQKHIVHKAVEQGTKIFACSDNTRSTTFALHTSFPRPNSPTVTPITDKELTLTIGGSESDLLRCICSVLYDREIH